MIHTALCRMKGYNEKGLDQPKHTGLTIVPSKCDCGCHGRN